jgi:hypothetical protein
VDRLDRAYTESIKEYDRLVTWISGGMLGLSVTFAERLGPRTQEGSTALLAWGWIVLGGALLMSLWSQYASSRVQSWRRRELDYLQVEEAKRPAGWREEAGRLDVIAGIYGKATKYLTFVSGLLLVGGFMLLARYAFVNVSGRSNEHAVAELRGEPGPIKTTDFPVPERRGLEDIPEPLPRPVVIQQPTDPGSEKK